MLILRPLQMRLHCKVLNAPSDRRAGKGTIILGTINTRRKRTSKPYLSVYTNASGNEENYPLDGTYEVKKILDKSVDKGMVTIEWKNPDRALFVSEAHPKDLDIFMNKFHAILRGENVSSLKEIKKEKKSEPEGPIELIVRRREDYPKMGNPFPSTNLKKLSLSGIGLKAVDKRWFNCSLLTHFDLSRNLLGSASNLIEMKWIGRLVNLQVLNLSNNGLKELPTEMVEAFPPSLLSLDLSFNQLCFIPSLPKLPSLAVLNMANNRLTNIPHEVVFRALLCLNLDNNHIKSIPYMKSIFRQTFSISGNPLDEPLCEPNLSERRCPSMLQLAMQTIKRNGSSIRLEKFLTVRFWEEDGIDFCDYCRISHAADLLIRFVRSIESSEISEQFAHNTRYPIKIIACRQCYHKWNPFVNPFLMRRRPIIMRAEEELSEEELKELWDERMEMATNLENEIRSMNLSKESNILGKVRAELKSLQRASRNLTRQSIDDGNLRHMRNVVDVAKSEYDRVEGLIRSFVLVDPKEGDTYKHSVDIVADGGAVWAKVISRTAKGVAMDWLTSSPRTVVQQGSIYVDHSNLFPHNFNPPRVIFHFTNGVPDLVAVKLERMGITVEGVRIPLERLQKAPEELLVELMKDEEEEGGEETEEGEGEGEGDGEDLPPIVVSSTAPVNLDVSAVFVLISNLTHPGGCDHKFSSKLLRQQSQMEKETKARDQLLSSIEGREWIVCETTLSSVKSIVSTVGGPTEKSRWAELENKLKVVADSPSERSLEMEKTTRLNERSIRVFGTGDELKYVTASANKHFVQSAFHQGVHYAVIIHESRALSEQKELPL